MCRTILDPDKEMHAAVAISLLAQVAADHYLATHKQRDIGPDA
jgi:hypothetical protein